MNFVLESNREIRDPRGFHRNVWVIKEIFMTFSNGESFQVDGHWTKRKTQAFFHEGEQDSFGEDPF